MASTQRSKCGAMLGLALVSSVGCGEPGDAIAPSAEGGAPPSEEVESATDPGAPTSSGTSPGECAGGRIQSRVPLPGYEIRTQAELDALAGCEIIRGSLSIEFAGPDLRPLRALREIDGELVLGAPGEASPLSLEGLENLERIGWGLGLGNVSSLAPLAGLRSLGADIDPDEQYESALAIYDCPELEDLAPLSGVTTPLVSLRVGGRLSSISGPPFAERMSSVWLEGVGGDVDLSALAGVRDIGRFAMHGTGIRNLDFLASLGRALALDIRTNPELADVTGITGLFHVNQLLLWDNAALQRLPAFTQLASAGMISIADNAALERIDGFPAVGRINGYELGSLSVQRNPALSAVLGGTIASASVIEITQNQSLQQIDLGALRHVQQTLAINSNPVLQTSGLPFLAEVEAHLIKLGGNAGDPTLLAPCPFIDDGICDEPPFDTLCAVASDTSDCDVRIEVGAPIPTE